MGLPLVFLGIRKYRDNFIHNDYHNPYCYDEVILMGFSWSVCHDQANNKQFYVSLCAQTVYILFINSYETFMNICGEPKTNLFGQQKPGISNDFSGTILQFICLTK